LVGRFLYLSASSITAAAAASRKEVKYSNLPALYSFQPIAVETLGPNIELAVTRISKLPPAYLF